MRGRVFAVIAVCLALLTAVVVSFSPLWMVAVAIMDPEDDYRSSAYASLMPLGGVAALWVFFALAVYLTRPGRLHLGSAHNGDKGTP